ncbi:MAG: single-stranded-DNA-specific exonuclease RecJ [Chloroflexi bacterium]|nr:single-stranded-DNA-specific exonuclease RecJ [Chloroflexota bacterium]
MLGGLRFPGWDTRPVRATGDGGAGALAHYPAPLPFLLSRRGVTSLDEAELFLGRRTQAAEDPLELPGVAPAASRLAQAVDSGERIAIFGDYDVDGVTGSALLALCLQGLGGVVRVRLPHRTQEGYGLSADAVAAVAREGARLLVTVDCGVGAVAEVEVACSLGLDVIVADHHVPPVRLPRALLVHPDLPGQGWPNRHPAAVGVCWRLAQAVERLLGRSGIARPEALALVALGTVADVAPLLGENRSMVREGLAGFPPQGRPGLAALVAQAGLGARGVDAEAVAFALAPRLNAAGRLDDASLALRLLCTEDPAEAQALAERLQELNRERQHLTREALERAREALVGSERAGVAVVWGPEYPLGIAGLVAARLVEERGCPAVVANCSEGLVRGSVRSVAGFHVARALDACSDLIVRGGGHAMAGGFTAHLSQMPALADRLAQLAAAALPSIGQAAMLSVEAEVPLPTLKGALLPLLLSLEPHGEGNPRPNLLARDVGFERVEPLADGQHLRMWLRQGAVSWPAVAFGLGGWRDRIGARGDVVFGLRRDGWGSGRAAGLLELEVVDLRPDPW